jgi:enoyl-[acyl-carrier-protein] reductase (NADH)
MVDAREIGWLAVFLASDRAEAITGELISPNGGAGNAVYY